MSIGIIGGGNIGLAFAKTLSRAGIAATIANSRGPDTLKESVAALGPTITPGTREQAAAADIVLIAVNWSKLPQAVAGLPPWGGRIVIDGNNPVEGPLFKPIDLQGRISSEVVADLVSGARLVKAFNHLKADVLASDPRHDGGRLVLFYSGDDSAAKAEVVIDRSRRICRHRPWSARARRQARTISRRAIAEPESLEDRIVPLTTFTDRLRDRQHFQQISFPRTVFQCGFRCPSKKANERRTCPAGISRLPADQHSGYLPLVSTFCFSSSFIFFTMGSRLASPVV